MSKETHSNKVSFENWYRAVAFNTDNGEVMVNLAATTEPVAFSVKRRIPYEKMYELCNDVAGLCIKDGVCHWEVFDLATDYFIVSYYTNLDCDITLDQVYELLHYTDVVDVIASVIGKSVYQDIREMARRVCKSALSMKRNELEVLAGRINEIIDAVESQDLLGEAPDIGKIEEIAKKIDELSKNIYGSTDNDNATGDGNTDNNNIIEGIFGDER